MPFPSHLLKSGPDNDDVRLTPKADTPWVEAANDPNEMWRTGELDALERQIE